VNKMTTREEILKDRKELMRKQNAIAQQDRKTEVQRDFVPSQPKTLPKREKPKSVPNVIQHHKTPKRTENKW